VTLDDFTPEQLIDAFLSKVCPDIYDPESEHFRDTPRRFTKMLTELTDSTEDFTFTTFDAISQEMVIVRGINFVSLCAHHIAPFTGTCFFAYIPSKKMAGLSKFVHTVRVYSHTMTNQEALTANIADCLDDTLDPMGVAVLMQASHGCMTTRGGLAHGTDTVTSAMRGVFNMHDRTAKSEFMTIIAGKLR
jgi:GTP cyclohydrolase I